MAVPDFTEVRILVVEDEATLEAFLRAILEHHGAQVHSSGSGDDAVKLWDAAHQSGKPYQIVITDLSLGPGLDGHAVARHIRQASLPTWIVACTGSVADAVVSTPLAFGFDACVAKPYLLAELFDQLPH